MTIALVENLPAELDDDSGALMGAVTTEFQQLMSWDAEGRQLVFPRDHPLLGGPECLVTGCVRQLEKRLSEQLGEQAWSASGLGAAPDIDQLHRHISMLEQELAEKRGELEERTEELEAARAANRELTRLMNQPSTR